MPKLARGDVDLHYEVSGTGPPLVLIAGMMSDNASWAPLSSLLEPDFTLICPDNRTTGQTHPWDAPVSLQHWVDDVDAVISELGQPRVHVVGHSLGGMIAWALACKAPQTVASLTLLASSQVQRARNTAFFKSLIAIRRSNAPEDTWLRTLFTWLFGDAVFSTPKMVDMAVQQSLAYPHAQAVDAMALQLQALEEIPANLFDTAPDVPVQALLAAEDMFMPYTAARASLGDIPVTEIASAGHSIHWDAPDAVASHIRKFTANIGV